MGSEPGALRHAVSCWGTRGARGPLLACAATVTARMGRARGRKLHISVRARCARACGSSGVCLRAHPRTRGVRWALPGCRPGRGAGRVLRSARTPDLPTRTAACACRATHSARDQCASRPLRPGEGSPAPRPAKLDTNPRMQHPLSTRTRKLVAMHTGSGETQTGPSAQAAGPGCARGSWRAMTPAGAGSAPRSSFLPRRTFKQRSLRCRVVP